MTGPTKRVLLALGSNLGDRSATLAGAVHDLAGLPGATLVAVSPVYESAAVKLDGVDNSAPRYLNAVLTIDYTGNPHALLDAVNAIEAEHGRVRAERWGDRTLDIDLIVFGQLSVDDDRLTLPHPRAAERDFVLAPWLDLDAKAAIPGRGLVRDLLAATDTTVRRVADAAAPAPAAVPGAWR
ncbi:MAG: 2-amino-4-hydroxy-6-hydroxymethyldihydropteridine diphosphokinase [Cryobacterium sp.]|uniref:2-amino-4-hydroxy-6- hydroxymethyldihydropteridine diphosphokinase n=1 Tax=unclassified Cryobacterium TaxID=2649013 RepID=UPI0018CAACE3|nr:MULTISPECIES: 2-amino-4-hydroxy-6-hydroxymethyldihydropteridine diphosphokinase [unclassified Cryobacterium]MCY7403343.1 2-amino-4-hydroxy-6-hydroxymethyldihydropteridine diphosphokinase [Cryobacterium sp.]MEC5154859.1 2-amino-4-hydroxy-6-hydroxymethyldihydropteridine diphosphokinase [Cryobacterium sp. CAN_C3]